jgi:hypothetical protein
MEFESFNEGTLLYMEYRGETAPPVGYYYWLLWAEGEDISCITSSEIRTKTESRD